MKRYTVTLTEDEREDLCGLISRERRKSLELLKV